MNFFRRLIKSKIGGYVALIFLLLVFVAFAAGDITGSGGLSVLGPSSAEVARIGNQTLTVAQLQDRTQRVFERYRQDKPEMTMAQFIAQDGLKQVADEMISTKAMIAYGEKHGMRISKKLIDAEIASNPAFADASGTFSQSQFDQLLGQQRIAEKDLREDLAGQLIQQQVLAAAGAGARAPQGFVPHYAGMLLEQRVGGMIAVPSANFAPAGPPDEAKLKAFYAANPDQFALPEQRKLRFALIERSRFDAQSEPTAAEVEAAYKARAANYAAREARTFTQLILPTQAQAKDFAAKAAAGQSLADLARAASLATTPIADLDQAGLAAQTSADIAKAAFSSAQGTLIGPLRSPLGWALLRVETVRTIAGTTLEQAKAELVPALRLEKSKQLLADLVNQIDGKLGNGTTLAEIAKDDNLTIVETPFVTAEGRNLRDPAYVADETVKALVKPGFAMSTDDDPQVVAVRPDEIAAIVAPGDVVPAGPPQLAEVRPAVELAWRLEQGATRARGTAAKINAALNKGVGIAAALKDAGIADAPQQALAVRRIELSQQQQQGPIPAPLQALFAMRAGSARVVPMERDQGFLVVHLDKIVEEDPASNPSLLQSTRAGISNVLGGEYARGLVAAIEQDLKVARNPVAMASVEAALRKANGATQ